MDLQDVERRHVVKCIEKAKQSVGYETQNTIKLIISDMFNKAMLEDIVLANPAKFINLEKPKIDRFVLTADEQNLFMEKTMHSFYHNLFAFMVNTGLRPGETFALTEADVSLLKKELHVTKTLSYQNFDGDTKKTFHEGPPKTTYSERVVPLTDAACEIWKNQLKLKRLVAELNSKLKGPLEGFEDLVFVTTRNTPLNSQIVCDAIKRQVLELNYILDPLERLPYFSPHTFRHTFATRCIEAGMRPKTLQKILGHATLQMTMDLYVHVTMDSIVDEMDLLGEYLDRGQQVVNVENDYITLVDGN